MTDPHDALYDRLLAHHGMVHTGAGQFVYQGSGLPVDTTHPGVVRRFRQVHGQAQQQVAASRPPVPVPGQAGDHGAGQGAGTALTDPLALLRGLLASPARDATLRLVALLRGSGLPTAEGPSPRAGDSGGPG